MAFKPGNMDYVTGMRGIAGLMIYTDQGHTIGDIRGANFFNHNEVRSFIQKQREAAGTEANNGVPVLAYGSNGGDMFWVTVAANGNVAAKTAAWQLKA